MPFHGPMGDPHGLLASMMPQLPGLLGGSQAMPQELAAQMAGGAGFPGPQPMPPGAPQPQQQQPMTPLQKLLGIDPTRMSPEAARQREALSLIAAGSQLTEDRGNLMGGIGRAVMTGRGVADQLGAQEQREQMLKRLGELSPDELHQGFQMALAQGDVDTASAIQKMVATQQAGVSGEANRPQVVSPGQSFVRYNPETGKVDVLFEKDAPPPSPVSQQVQDVVLPDGTVARVAVNPETLEQTVIPGRPVPSTAQSQAASFAGQSISAHETLSRLEQEGFGTPNFWQELAIEGQDVPVLGTLARAGMGGDAQQFSDAREAFAEMFVRDVSGAAIRPDEARRSARLFVPQFGDSPRTIEEKRKRRELFIEQTSLRSGEPNRFRTASEALDAVFGEAAGTQRDAPTFEEWQRSRRAGGDD